MPILISLIICPVVSFLLLCTSIFQVNSFNPEILMQNDNTQSGYDDKMNNFIADVEFLKNSNLKANISGNRPSSVQYLMETLKRHRRKSDTKRESLAEATANDFHETSLGKNKRNNILYEIKDFIVKNFPQKKRKGTSHVDHKKTNAEPENDKDDDDDGNAPQKDDNGTDFDVESSREVLEEVKDFVVKNFHPEGVKGMSNSVERSATLPPPVYTEEEQEGAVSVKVKREENNLPSSEEMANATLSEYDDYYETDHPKRDLDAFLSVPKNNNADYENKDTTPTEPKPISRYPEDTTTVQPAEYSTEPDDVGEEWNNMTEAFSDGESEYPMTQSMTQSLTYDSNLSKSKRESAPYVTSEINADGTVTGGSASYPSELHDEKLHGKNANLENGSPRSVVDIETPSFPTDTDLKIQERDRGREEDVEEEAEFDYEDTSEPDNSEMDSTKKMNKRVTSSQNGLLQNQKGFFPTEDQKHKNGAQTAKNSAHVHEELASSGTQIKEIPGLSKHRQQNKNFTRTLGSEDRSQNLGKYGNEITGQGVIIGSPSQQKETFKRKFSESKYTTVTSDNFEHNYKVRENDEELKSHLNSLTHPKIRTKREKYESRTKAREVLGAGPTVLPKFSNVQILSSNLSTMQWLLGTATLLAAIVLTLEIYQAISKRQNPKISPSGDLKEVCVKCNGTNPDVFNTLNEYAAKWQHDVRQFNDFVEETLQNCENSENGNTEQAYSTLQHLAKIRAAITGTIE